jgi:hypothetical protein
MLRLYLYARVRFPLCTLHTRPRVQRAPGVPCALFLMGETICKARAKRATGMRRCVLCHGERQIIQSSSPGKSAKRVLASSDRAIQYSRDISERAEKPRPWVARSSRAMTAERGRVRPVNADNDGSALRKLNREAVAGGVE